MPAEKITLEELRVRIPNATSSELRLLVEDIYAVADFFSRMKQDKIFLNPAGRKRKLFDEIELRRKNLREVQDLCNALIQITENSIGGLNAEFFDPSGKKFMLSSHQIMSILLLGYVAHYEGLFDLLDMFIDFNLMGRKLSKSKKFNYSANGVKNRLIREYMGGKLFGGADSNLRNAIAHFSYVLDGEGVHYKTEGRNETVLSLYDFFNERNKRLNISLNAVWIYLTMIELGGESLLPFEEIKKTVFPKLS